MKVSTYDTLVVIFIDFVCAFLRKLSWSKSFWENVGYKNMEFNKIWWFNDDIDTETHNFTGLSSKFCSPKDRKSWWFQFLKLNFVNLCISLSLHDMLLLKCSKAKHPNIVKLLGKINLRDGKWIIPLEFIFGEDLETTIFHASKSKIQVKL